MTISDNVSAPVLFFRAQVSYIVSPRYFLASLPSQSIFSQYSFATRSRPEGISAGGSVSSSSIMNCFSDSVSFCLSNLYSFDSQACLISLLSSSSVKGAFLRRNSIRSWVRSIVIPINHNLSYIYDLYTPVIFEFSISSYNHFSSLPYFYKYINANFVSCLLL